MDFAAPPINCLMSAVAAACRLIGPVALASLIIVSPATASSCPRDALGPNYPWLINEIMAGDRFAEVYLDFDKAGQPSGCRLGNTNISSDEQFNVCLAFAGYTINRKSDVPLPTTIKRIYLELGGLHLKAQREARKAFFQQHPYERPDCYPAAE